MGDFRRPFERIGIHGEAVILRSDLDLASGEIHYRLIAAMVTELELERFTAERQTKNLMAETDAEDRFFTDQFLHVGFGIRHRVRIAWSVGEKNAIRI